MRKVTSITNQPNIVRGSGKMLYDKDDMAPMQVQTVYNTASRALRK